MITFSMIVIWTSYLLFLYLVVFWLLVFFEEDAPDQDLSLTRHPTVSIVIPALNEEKRVIDTLDSALALHYPKELIQIIVINDGSRDKTKAMVETYISEHTDRNITLIHHEHNKGKGASMNEALAISTGEFFIPFDADSLIRADALEKLLPEFESSEDVATVLPLMKVWQPKTFLQKIQWAEYMVNLFYKKLMSYLDCVSVAPGPFSVYRKKHVQAIGGFHENNLTEDLEITLRLQQHHYKIIQSFKTEVYTKAPPTWKKFYSQRNRWYKGTLLNAFNYKHMAFNKKYGDFGMIQMPRLLLESILVIAIVAIVLYTNILAPLSHKLSNLLAVNFNIIPAVNWGMQHFTLLDLNVINIFFSITTIITAGLLLYYAHKACNEPLTKEGYLTIPSYVLIYGILASIVLCGVFIDLARGKKQKW